MDWVWNRVGSQKILDNMNKASSVEQARTAIINTRKVGIFPNTTFIFGYPGECKETIQETVNFKNELSIKCGSFFITPYPGTTLFDEIKDIIGNEEKYIKSLNDATDFCVNLTNFNDIEFFDLKNKMDTNTTIAGLKT